MTVIDYRRYFGRGWKNTPPDFWELSLHQQIIEFQKRGLTLRQIAGMLKRDYDVICASILAWLREV